MPSEFRGSALRARRSPVPRAAPLDRIYAVRDVGKNARNIDTALADVKARVAHDAYHLGAPRRYLAIGIAEMGEMEPLARQCVEVCRGVTKPQEEGGLHINILHIY